MRARIIGAAALATLMATPAAATDWYMTSESATASSASFIDKDSIRPAGEGLMQARFYIVYAVDEADGTAAAEAAMEYDCSRPRSRFLRLATYDRDQHRLSDDPGSGNWGSIETNTQEDTIRRFVCSNGRSLPASASRGAAFPFERARALLLRHRAEDAQRH